MPRIFEIGCSSCAYAETHAEAMAWLVMEDGSRVELPHPVERRVAERVSGLAWNDLLRAGRIRSSDAMICIACGRTTQVDQGPRAKGRPMSQSTVDRPGRHGMQPECPACANGPLRPIGPPGEKNTAIGAGLPWTLCIAFGLLALLLWGDLLWATSSGGVATNPTGTAMALTALSVATYWLARRMQKRTGTGQARSKCPPCPACGRTETFEVRQWGLS